MSDLRELYQEVILDHTRQPRNKGALAQTSHQAEGFNPLCGDKVNLFLSIKEGVIEDICFDGSGCAISTASVSMLTEHLKGRPVAEVAPLFKKFHDVVTGEKELDEDGPDLGKLVIFQGVRDYVSRVKCATLCWHTLLAAIEGRGEKVKTE